jgi:alpha-glucuronidase
MIIGIKRLFLIVFAISLVGTLQAEDGYRLWLRYDQIKNVQLLQQYRAAISSIQILGTTPTSVISKEELINGLESLLGKNISVPNNGGQHISWHSCKFCSHPWSNFAR